jgi:succinate-semialdehyde dehydrogenase / glutarate-semialdehyde dehydrogenase
MTLAADRTAAAGGGETFDSLDPVTGEVVARFPEHDEAAVRAAVARARAAAAWWREQGHAGRRARLHGWKALLARRAGDLAELVHRETGKPVPDAALEITLAVDQLAWAARHAARVLGQRKVPSGLLMSNQSAYLEYLPFGVVGVIGPWNYPVFTPMGSIAYALAAGNAVVFKPSEHTPAVGQWLAAAFAEVVPEHPVLQVVTGRGGTGAALCRSGVDKLAFTGSAATGRRVMAACAEGLVPVLMECGGKDALIVDDDADVSAAADAALWGGMSNGGQTCIGIERVYATERVYDGFVRELVARAAAVRPGSGRGASYGPVTVPSQVEVVRDHIADALARGGRALTGGGIEGGYVQPTVLVDVPEDSRAVQEETFGPTLTVTRVRDADEAVERANATAYGLGGAVFSRSRGHELARRLDAGMVSVNQVIAFAGVPSLPFGGSGESGFGRIHGEDGLREFARSRSITVQRFPLPVPLLSFRRHRTVDLVLGKVVRLLHGRG